MLERKKLVHRIWKLLAKNSVNQILQILLGADLLNLAVFSLIYDARKKKINASDTVIPSKDFLLFPDF